MAEHERPNELWRDLPEDLWEGLPPVDFARGIRNKASFGLDRAATYRAFRGAFGHGLYAADLDFVELRSSPSGPVPVAVIELQVIGGLNRAGGKPGDAYLNSVVMHKDSRYAGDFAYKAARAMGREDGVKVGCYLVLCPGDNRMQEFYVFNYQYWVDHVRDNSHLGFRSVRDRLRANGIEEGSGWADAARGWRTMSKREYYDWIAGMKITPAG